MLQYLKIQNLALLESVTLELEAGFTSVTGETGAGKSVLLGALNLLSGARSNKEMIRQGSEKLEIEAGLFFSDTKAVNTVLEELGLPMCDEGSLILYRSLDQSKIARIRVNGSLATLGQLKALGEYWVDFHGPGEPQKLFKEACQLSLLDAYARNEAMLKEYAASFQEWSDLLKEIDDLRHSERLEPDAVAFLKNEIGKLEQIDLSEEAIAELESNYLKITQAQELQSLLQMASQLLSAESGINEQLNALVMKLSALKDLDASCLELFERAEAMQIESDDLNRELEQLSGGFDFEPETIELTLSQMNTWQEIKRKYGSSLKAVLEKKAALEKKLSSQGDIDATLTHLEAKASECERTLESIAQGLFKVRQKAAKALSAQVSKLFASLGFKKAQLSIELSRSEQLTPSGGSQCQFLFAPNVGQEALPLNKIASSGETARVMLALKTVLADFDQTPLLVFDEVDANVGGEVGRSVGIEMARIAEKHQVFCVTHLPQVASLSKQHLLVEKMQEDGETRVKIAPIHGNKTERLGEIARMLGDRSSKSALSHAKELLA
jgi:DNA repair protein RecN (Recombination protein N)